MEICIVGKRKGGHIPRPRGSRKERQFLSQRKGTHSAKPPEVRDRIMRMFPKSPKLEMFATATHRGWHAHGLVVRNGIVIPGRLAA